jgi:AraC-like DNA-binding protein
VYREFSPAADLAEVVKCYWSYHHVVTGPHVERVVPDGFVDFVLHAGERPILDLAGRSFRKPSVFTGGQLTTGGVLRTAGTLTMFGIKLFPWAPHLVYRPPLVSLNDRRESLDAIVPAMVRTRYEELVSLVNEGEFAATVAVANGLVRSWLRDWTGRGRLLQQLVLRAHRTNGTDSLTAASRALAVSERTIQSVFAEHRGMTYKYYLRIRRVQAVLKRFRRGTTLGALAAECGFFDQAHMVKDFQRIVGCAPSRLFAEDNGYLAALVVR